MPLQVTASDPSNTPGSPSQVDSITKEVNLTHVVTAPDVVTYKGSMKLSIDGFLISCCVENNIRCYIQVVVGNQQLEAYITPESAMNPPYGNYIWAELDDVLVKQGDTIPCMFYLNWEVSPEDYGKVFMDSEVYAAIPRNCNFDGFRVIPVEDGMHPSFSHEFNINVTGDDFVCTIRVYD